MTNNNPVAITYNNYDLNNVKFSDAANATSSNIVAFISLEVDGKKQKHRLQSPKVCSPFGVTIGTNKHNKKQCKLVVTTKGKEDDPEIMEYYQKETAFDELLATKAIQFNWPKIDGLTLSLLAQMKMVKKNVYSYTGKDKKGGVKVFEPSITYDIALDEKDVPILNVFDQYKNQCSYTDIKPWMPFVIIAEKTAVWKNAKISVNIKATHVMIFTDDKKTVTISDEAAVFAFIKPSNENSNNTLNENADSQVNQSTNGKRKTADTIAEDNETKRTKTENDKLNNTQKTTDENNETNTQK